MASILRDSFFKSAPVIRDICIKKMTYMYSDFLDLIVSNPDSDISSELGFNFQIFCSHVNIYCDRITSLLFDLFCEKSNDEKIYFEIFRNGGLKNYVRCDGILKDQIIIPILDEIHKFFEEKCKNLIKIRLSNIGNIYKHCNSLLDVRKMDDFLPVYKIFHEKKDFDVETIRITIAEASLLLNHIHERINYLFNIFPLFPSNVPVETEAIVSDDEHNYEKLTLKTVDIKYIYKHDDKIGKYIFFFEIIHKDPNDERNSLVYGGQDFGFSDIYDHICNKERTNFDYLMNPHRAININKDFQPFCNIMLNLSPSVFSNNGNHDKTNAAVEYIHVIKQFPQIFIEKLLHHLVFDQKLYENLQDRDFKIICQELKGLNTIFNNYNYFLKFIDEDKRIHKRNDKMYEHVKKI